MRVLIAPLNWGLGHASRCIPLIIRYLRAGDEVVLGGDGDALTLLRQHFPNLPYCQLAPLDIRYGSRSQVWAMAAALPKLLRFTVLDHRLLDHLLQNEHLDLVISDNRFGLYSNKVRCAYITHQLVIPLPSSLRFLEPLLQRIHYHFINKYTECLIPDTAEPDGLGGRLSHPALLPRNARYIGPLSRLVPPADAGSSAPAYPVVAVLSGPEPQRTMLERKVIETWKDREERVLIVRGLVGKPSTRMSKGNITLVPYLSDTELSQALCSARTVISRSGYSSVMDYAALGLTDKARQGRLQLTMIPTPGQPEQEYLAQIHCFGQPTVAL